MDMRRRTLEVAENVRAALASSASSTSDVAKVANVTVPQLESRLEGREDFDIAELVRVGDFLHVSPADLLPKRRAFRCSLPGRAVVVVADDVDQACDIVFAEQGVHPYEVVAA